MLTADQTNASLHYGVGEKLLCQIDEKGVHLISELDDLTADDSSRYAMN